MESDAKERFMANVLLIGHQPDLYMHLSRLFADGGHSLKVVSSLEDGIRHCRASSCQLVVLEEGMDNALEGIPRLRSTQAAPQVVVVAERYNPERGKAALLSGALNYMPKGKAPRAITTLLERLPSFGGNGAEGPDLRDFGIFGSSAALRAQFETIARSSNANVNVLLQGETGTGKELFARAIHRMSQRRGGPLITVDCASLPEHLVESLLFGYSQGAFTGAAKSRVGLIRQADGGTLFLDEVSELPMSLQKKFLRVLQERRYRPVGGGSEESSDFRLVAATNKDLQEMVREGTFRDDLLYRISTMRVLLPPLRERGLDIIEIAEHLLQSRAESNGGKVWQMSAEFRARLLAHPWPGNVRELVNVIDCTLAVAGDGDMLFAEHLPATIHAGMLPQSSRPWQGRTPARRSTDVTHHGMHDRAGKMAHGVANGAAPSYASHGPSQGPSHGRPHDTADEAASYATHVGGAHPDALPSFREARREALEAFEHAYLATLYEAVGGDIRQACSLSNLSRARLYELLRKHAIME